MAGIVADLLVRVGGDVRPFQTAMAEVATGLDETAAKGSKFGGVMAGAGLLAAGAVTGVVAFGIAAVAHATEAGQAAFELSEKFGLLPERASAWLAVGAQLGLSGDQIGKGFQFLSKNVSAMQLTLDAGGKISAATGQVYKELGINVLDSGGKVKTADELMLESADAFKGMKDGPEKAALAMKLFGKSGTDLLPVLNLGRKGVQDLMDKGKEAGAVMSGPQVEAAHKLFLEHKALDTAVSGVSTRFGSALMPILTTAIAVLLSIADKVTNFKIGLTTLAPWFPVIGAALVLVGGVLGSVLIPMFIAWTVATWAQVTALIAQSVAMVLAYAPILLIIAGIALLVGAVILIMQHWDFLKAKTTEVWGAIKEHVLGIVTWFGSVPGLLASTAAGMWNGIWNAFRAMLNMIIGAWNSLHFTIGGGTFAGVSIPSITLGVPPIPSFHGGGMVPGSGDVLALLKGGERVSTQEQVSAGDARLHDLVGQLIELQALTVVHLARIASPTPRGGMYTVQKLGG